MTTSATPGDPDGPDLDERRADSRDAWERAAGGWGSVADSIQRWALEVSATMVDAVALQPGDRVLELAAGPGDTGFMAAELVRPGGTLISTDGAEAMVDVARERARAQEIDNVEFRTLELEWIDLPTADVDAVLCRWGIMLVQDPGAAAREIRRVLRPGRHAALAVWDAAERNPWATIPRRVMEELGHLEPPPTPSSCLEPGQFALADDGALAALLQDAGFTEVTVAPVAMVRRLDSVADYLAATVAMSPSSRAVWDELGEAERTAVTERLAAEARPFTADDGSLALPGSTLVAAACA